MTDDGGAAFPISRENEAWFNTGMSLRDWFAGQAMQGLVEHDATGLVQAISEGKGESALSQTARLAYLIATHMLIQRQRK